MVLSYLHGTATAPLAATWRYTFFHALTPEGEAMLTIPISYRGSWDDYGIVERPEQEVFVWRLMASIGVEQTRCGYPGEWIFADTATFGRLWDALTARLTPPVAAPPTATAQRPVSADEAPRLSAGLLPRFLELVSVVAGLTEGAFECFDSRSGTGSEPRRSEHWRRGHVYVALEELALDSGGGPGEQLALTIKCTTGHGRDARVDWRTGGALSITVSGVLDAQALAEAFVEAGRAGIGPA